MTDATESRGYFQSGLWRLTGTYHSATLAEGGLVLSPPQGTSRMTKKTLAEAVSTFGAQAKAKLDNKAISGEGDVPPSVENAEAGVAG